MNNPFEKLSLHDRAQIVWEQGQYIDSIVYYNQRINLYTIGATFIEVIYHPQLNEIIEIRKVDDTSMKKYLSQIKIS